MSLSVLFEITGIPILHGPSPAVVIKKLPLNAEAHVVLLATRSQRARGRSSNVVVVGIAGWTAVGKRLIARHWWW